MMPTPFPFLLPLSLAILAATAVCLRVISLIRSAHRLNRSSHPTAHRHPPAHSTSCPLTVLLGSGGHTAEMIRLLSNLPFHRYSPRTYLISSGDSISRSQILQLESFVNAGHVSFSLSLCAHPNPNPYPLHQYSFREIPRARTVNQSFFTSIFSTVYSLMWCLWFITFQPLLSPNPLSTPSAKSSRQENNSQVSRAELILLNGPGSAVPIALSAFATKFITGRTDSPRVIYVESLARVKRLSLTGLVLLPLVDCFVVQWMALHDVVRQSGWYRSLHRFGLVPSITFDGWMV